MKTSVLRVVAFISAFTLLINTVGPAVAIAQDDTGTASGITHSEYPNGLPYASFNNYTDNASGGIGIEDERNFLVGRNESTGSEYTDTVEVNPGDVILLTAFFHNNGYADEAATTAYDTVTKMPGFADSGNGYQSASGSELIVKQNIFSSSTTPAEAEDDLTIVSQTGEPVVLRYRTNLSVTPNKGGDFTALDVNGFFGNGALIGDPTNPTGGTFRGHMTNAMHTFAYFDVVAASDAENISHSAAEPTTSPAPDAGVEIISLDGAEDIYNPDCVVIFTKQVSTDGINYQESVTVKNGATVYYRIKLHQTDSSSYLATLKLKDALSAPTAGGSLSDIQNLQFSCANAQGGCTGTFASGGNITVNKLPGSNANSYPLKEVSFTYTRKASDTGITAGSSSKIIDTVSVVSGGSGSDKAEVIIKKDLPTPTPTPTPTPKPDFAVVKEVKKSGGAYASSVTVNTGETAEYRVTVTNNGNGVGDVSVTDRLDPPTNGGSLGSISGQSVTCASGATCNGNISSGLSIGALAPGKSVVITYNRLANNSGIPVGDNSDVTDYADLSNGKFGKATVKIVGAAANPQFTIEKRVSNGGTFFQNVSVENGRTAYYRVVVKNSGNVAGTVTLTDSLAAPTNGGSLSNILNEDIDEGVDCDKVSHTGSLSGGGVTFSNLQPGQYACVDYQRTAANSGVPAGQNSIVTDTAKLSTGAQDDASVTIIGPGLAPNFTIKKEVSTNGTTFSKNISLENGATAFYRLVVTNTGQGTGSVRVTDTLGAASNGGVLGNITNQDPHCDSEAVCGGTLTTGGIDIGNLKPGKSVTIYYRRVADATGIPNGGSSIFVDTAALSSGASDTASVCIKGPAFFADFSIQKKVADASQVWQENIARKNGETAYYRISIQNTGTGPGTITVKDSLGAPTAGGSLGAIINETYDYNTGTTYTGSLANSNGITINNLPAGDYFLIDYQRVANTTGIGTGKNSTVIDTASLLVNDQVKASDTASVSLEAEDAGYLKVSKEVKKDGQGYGEIVTLNNGETAYYRLTVTNDGAGPAMALLTDVLSAPTNGGNLGAITNEQYSCSNCSGSLAGNGINITLPAKSSATFTYQRQASNAGIPGGSSSNIIDTAVLSKNGTLDTDTAMVTVMGPPSAPTCSNFLATPSAVDPNQPFTLSWNAGNQQSFRLEATPGQVVNQNGSTSIYEVTAGITGQTSYTVTVFNKPDQQGESAKCPATVVTINQPAYEITKKVSSDGTNYGEAITIEHSQTAYYLVVVKNAGSRLGAVKLTDVLANGTQGGSLNLSAPATVTPPGVCTGGDFFDISNPLECILAPNATATILYTRTANNSGIPVTKTSDFVNTAKIVGTEIKDTAKVTVKGPKGAADLATQLYASDYSVPPSTSAEPTVIDFRVDWQNLGNVDMNKTTLKISCDASAIANLQSAEGTVSGNTITYGPFNTLAGEPEYKAGSFGTYSFTGTLVNGYGDPAAKNFTCNAHIESADFLPIDLKETNKLNNDDMVEIFVSTVNADQRAKKVKNLRTGAEGTIVAADAGDELLYTLTYRAGNKAVNGFTFSDDISDILEYATVTDPGSGTVSGKTISWASRSVAQFEKVDVTFKVKVTDDLKSKGGDFRMTNAYGKDTVVVELPKIIKSKVVQVNNGPKVTEATAKPGDYLTYTLRVENKGELPVFNFVIEEDINDILEYADITDNGGGTVANGTISWELAFLNCDEPPAPPTYAEVSFTVKVKDPIPGGGDYTLTNVYGNETNVYLSTIKQSKKVKNERSGESGVYVTAEAGDTLTYTISVKEMGGKAAENDYIFSDYVGDILKHATLQNTSDGGTLDEPTGTINWPKTDIGAGDTKTRTFSVIVKEEDKWPEGNDLSMDNWYGNSVTVTLGKVEVDNVILKSVDQAEVSPDSKMVFTLSYYNQGTRNATSSVITDDFDESAITIDTKPDYCEIITDGGNQKLQCNVGTVVAGADRRSIVYSATVRADTTANVVANTAKITQAQVDIDLSNNTASTSTPINHGGLVITKSVSPSSLPNGGVANYTITVTNNSAVKKTFSITDELVVANGDADGLPGNNGGELIGNMNSSVSFAPVGSGNNSGNIQQGITITDLKPQAVVTITYTRTADNETIPFNSSSLFVNKATIVETQQSATAQVWIVGPQKGCEGPSCGGGGGGGGGGGRRQVVGSLNLYIEKEVKGTDGKWHDADTYDMAALIGTAKQQDVDYRIIIRNEGNRTGENLEIEDTFRSESLIRKTVKNVEGGTWDGKTEVFGIKELRAAKTTTIAYTAELVTTGKYQEVASGENIAEIIGAEPVNKAIGGLPSKKTTVQGIGRKDPAFVTTKIDRDEHHIALKKNADKKEVKPGEAVTWTIVLFNSGEFTYENVTLTDNFPFQFLDLESANDLRGVNKGANTLTFTKKVLKPGDVWTIRMRTTVKPGVPGDTTVRNTIKAAAENADLSSLYAFAEVIVTPMPRPAVLISSGPASTALLILTLSLAGFVTMRRIRRTSLQK